MTRKLFGMILCAVLSVVAFGQNATTSVRGTVTDPTGAFLQGATVTLTNTTTQVSQEQKVGKNGEYNFVNVQPATYAISVVAAGFGKLEQQTELLVSQPATLNSKLTVGSTAQTVEVSASSTINFSDATLGNAISSAQIEAMPIDSRNVADLLSFCSPESCISTTTTAPAIRPRPKIAAWERLLVLVPIRETSRLMVLIIMTRPLDTPSPAFCGPRWIRRRNTG
jgi:hypothetical protein